MQTIFGIEHIEAAPSCVSFGVFDGVHLGHQAVLRRMVDNGRAAGSRTVAMTFDPHPDAVIGRGGPPLLLTTLEEKIEAIADCNDPDVLLVARFDRDLAAMEAEDFVRRVLAETIGARCVVVGHDAVFGSRGRGNIALLRQLGARLGMPTVEQVGSISVHARDVSSSAIRALLTQGDVVLAREMLGRPYALGGAVVRGHAVGKTMGFPTVNLHPDAGKLIPAPGVYAGWADVGREPATRQRGGEQAQTAGKHWPAALSIGTRETFGGTELAIEAYLLDYSGDLYGQRVALKFWERLRGQQRFDSAEALRAQMADDVQRTRAALPEEIPGCTL